MSYILDALRRAEAERERGAVPSLQSQQHTVIEEDEAAPRSRSMMWVAIALAAALVAALAWNLLGGSTPAPRPIAEGTVTAPPAPPAPVAIAPAAPPVAAPSETAPPAATAPIAAPAVAPPLPAAPKTAAVAAAESRRTKRHEGANALAPAPTPAPTPAAATPAAPRAETRIYAQAELPEEVRRDLPKVAINGSSYSGDPASRMVMINGQIFHEGDKLGNGLALEKINRRSAVFAFRGYRYEITF